MINICLEGEGRNKLINSKRLNEKIFKLVQKCSRCVHIYY